MTRKISRYGALVIVANVSTLRIDAATAGPCAKEINTFRNSLSHDAKGEPTFVASAPQSIGAQLKHQPTQESVVRAKKQAQGQIFAVLAQADAFDLEGERSECMATVAKAKILLNP